MVGKTWTSEMSASHDPKTGQLIYQLTSSGNNVPLYFTENSFDQNKNQIIFLSDRASGVDSRPQDNPHYNLFRLDLDSGEIVQLTDEPQTVGPFGNVTKTPASRFVVYSMGNLLRRLDTQSGEIITLYEEKGDYFLGSPSIACNQRYVAFTRNENRHIADGPNYTGFKDNFYEIKDGRVTLAYMDGSGWVDILKDTHWTGHFQFCPDDPTLGTFCHEGPWNLVTQRIWLLDFVSREAQPCFRQKEQDSIGHEFWTQDGFIFFDDRGPGHDGTITSSRTQAVELEVKVNQNEMIPFVGLVDRFGKLVRKIDMPFYCNHYHANPEHTVLVGDDVDELVLIDISGEKAELKPLCSHGTSWHTQSSHCHPTWSWDGSRILYASDRGGKVNIYLVHL